MKSKEKFRIFLYRPNQSNISVPLWMNLYQFSMLCIVWNRKFQYWQLINISYNHYRKQKCYCRTYNTPLLNMAFQPHIWKFQTLLAFWKSKKNHIKIKTKFYANKSLYCCNGNPGTEEPYEKMVCAPIETQTDSFGQNQRMKPVNENFFYYFTAKNAHAWLKKNWSFISNVNPSKWNIDF